ncbi:hypothetical protein chiPu_0020070 [Chiloscyllium punctatum]|uniref:Uncharacterized protein n=1 Tax=Chiloscyllium punctatum TaxID=137246 RepID=A0A401RU01_CHIPU|nr:hypothetical protein [Chiloscyllium punctatum]
MVLESDISLRRVGSRKSDEQTGIRDWEWGKMSYVIKQVISSYKDQLQLPNSDLLAENQGQLRLGDSDFMSIEIGNGESALQG